MDPGTGQKASGDMGAFMQDNAGKADEEIDRPGRHRSCPEMIQRVRECNHKDPGNDYEKVSAAIHDPRCVKEDGTYFFISFVLKVLTD